MKIIFVSLLSLMILSSDVFASDTTAEIELIDCADPDSEKLAHAKQLRRWLKTQQNKCALGSAYSFAFILSYVPLDLLMQVFQYYCLEGDCEPHQQLIKREVGDASFACCYEPGRDSTCAKKDASKSKTSDLYYTAGCDIGLSADLINQIIPCTSVGIKINDTCFKEVLLIPSAALFCGVVAETLYAGGFIFFYGAGKIQEYRLASLDPEVSSGSETTGFWAGKLSACFTWLSKNICFWPYEETD